MPHHSAPLPKRNRAQALASGVIAAAKSPTAENNAPQAQRTVPTAQQQTMRIARQQFILGLFS